MNKADKLRINELVLKVLAEDVSPEEFAELNRLVATSRVHAEYYAKGIADTIALAETQGILDESLGLEHGGARDIKTLNQELRRLLSMEQNAPAVPAEKPVPVVEKKDIQVNQKSKTIRPTVWFWMSAAALVVLALWVSLTPPRPQQVATLVDLYHAQWSDPEAAPQLGGRLYDRSEPLELARGLAKIRFNNEASVVIEGPTTFQIKKSDELFLPEGKLSVRIPPAAEGFRVNTPHCRIVDLGTEFGVQAHKDGRAEVSMFKGKAALYPGGQQEAKPNRLIQAGQARTVDKAGVIHETEFCVGDYVQQFSSNAGVVWSGQSIDLADIVGGGHGLGSGRLGYGVDYRTGRITSDPIAVTPIKGQVGYMPVPDSPYIDGIFMTVPGPLEVTSAGHQLPQCPRAQTTFAAGVRNHPVKRYASTERPFQSAVFIHANEGITFDLCAIRNFIQTLHPEMTLSRFTAGFRMQSMPTEIEATIEPSALPMVGMMVLIDGECRFARKDVNAAMPLIPIDIRLADSNEFLTIIVTEGRTGLKQYDWSLLIDPFLEVSY